MPRHLHRHPLAALALTAIALMIVLLPSRTAAMAHAAAPPPAIQAIAVDTAVQRVGPAARGRPVVRATPSPAPTEEPTAPATLAPVPVTAAAPVAVAPRPVPAAPPPPAVTPPPTAACPATFFCYPRLGIAGVIVPYGDCSGATDVGVAIRQLTCVRQGIWLAGHAYTQFGGIAGFRIGDVVIVRGQRFEVTGSSVQRACAPSTIATAPLSLQTSLDATACGRVLVVQARPLS